MSSNDVIVEKEKKHKRRSAVLKISVMSKFKFASEHIITNNEDFGDLYPKSAREAGRNSSFTVERAAGDVLKTNYRNEKTMNADIGNRIDYGFATRSFVRELSPLNIENEEEIISSSPLLSDSSVDIWEQNPVIPSYDAFCSYLEMQEDIPASGNGTNIPTPRTSTPISFLEQRQESEESLESNEMETKCKLTTIASSKFPPADDLNTDHVKSRVMVRGQSDGSTVNWEKELHPYLQIKPKATAQNEGGTKAISEKPDVEKNKKFSLNGAEYLNSPESNRKTNMVEIRTENDVFFADHDLLSRYSLYFGKLFSTKSEKYRLPMIIRVSGISSEVFRVFLDFVHRRNFTVNSNTLDKLIKMSDVFSIPLLKQHCLKLLDKISLENAVNILRDKRHIPSSGLFAFLVSRISEEFPNLYNSVSFYELDVSVVCRVLSNDDIQIVREMEVLQVALKWIGHSMNERRQYLSRVMSCVRFNWMTQDELFQCLEITPWLKECNEMREILMRANWVITAGILDRGDPFNVQASSERTCFRGTRPYLKKKSSSFFKAQIFPDVRVVVEAFYPPKEATAWNQNTATTQQYGGVCGNQERRSYFENKQVNQVQYYDSLRNHETHNTNLPGCRSNHASTVLHGKLYVFGGFDPEKANTVAVPTKDAFVFNFETKKWTQLESMNTARMHHSICTLDGVLYVFGGEDDRSRALSSVECYNPKTNSWFFVKSMLTPRLGASAVELDGKIIVAGGYVKTTQRTEDLVLGSVESYDPRLNRWMPKNPLRFPRCYGNLVNVNGNLYLCGGATYSFDTNELRSVPSIDIYIKSRDFWEEVANLSVARHHAGCTVTGGRIYIIGGISTEAKNIVQSVECYDVTKDAWFTNIKDVPFPTR